MIRTDSNHCDIVREVLEGKGEMDEQAAASLRILAERLERLRRFDRMFSKVRFSAAMEKLRKHQLAAVTST